MWGKFGALDGLDGSRIARRAGGGGQHVTDSISGHWPGYLPVPTNHTTLKDFGRKSRPGPRFFISFFYLIKKKKEKEYNRIEVLIGKGFAKEIGGLKWL